MFVVEQMLVLVCEVGSEGCVFSGDIVDVVVDWWVIVQVVQVMGWVDILVNNVGIEWCVLFVEVIQVDYDVVLGVNLCGVFFVIQVFVCYVVECGDGGVVVNVSLVYEELLFLYFVSYVVSKGGLKMLMCDLVIELVLLGICVNNIVLGVIQMLINVVLMVQLEKFVVLMGNILFKWLGMFEDVVNVVVFLVSDEVVYIIGIMLYVDGGLLWNYVE